jgi:hypothetical protein
MAHRVEDRMTARDIVTIGFYGLVFSSVVVWATLRPTNDDLAASSATLRSSSSSAPIDHAEEFSGIRRTVQRAMLR